LRYSAPVKHVRDTDGKYPFVVAGYRISRAGAASGKTLTLVLVEKAAPDPKAKPVIRYRTTRLQPVSDRHGHQAVAQLFKTTTPHGHVPPAAPPPSPPPPPPAPDTDPDRDGYAAPADCKPDDPAVHPGATDRPDLAFLDTNCDGIDGDEANSVFVSPTGNDANPGTKAKPKREPQAALAALGARKDILLAHGGYGRLELLGAPAIGVGVYGGYDDVTWGRSATGIASQLNGGGEGVLVVGTYRIVLQLLTVQGLPGGSFGTAYGIRAVQVHDDASPSALLIQNVVVVSAGGLGGLAGGDGAAGAAGAPGDDGRAGGCDTGPSGAGGAGGASPSGRAGGAGGRGGNEGQYAGLSGEVGQVGTPGGVGGASQPYGQGWSGRPGQNGTSGAAGAKGADSLDAGYTALGWKVGEAGAGANGLPGNGGGGGGGGGGQGGAFVNDGAGDGAGGGGAGGEPGTGGAGGIGGGGSFGLYLVGSNVTIEGGSISTGQGGVGGYGGQGGLGALGGAGGLGSTYCRSEIGGGGNGGTGGRGGNGGNGGGGQGGPSIGVVEIGSQVAIKNTPINVSQGGFGGRSGAGETPATHGASAEIVELPTAP
jgi:hypothetical protein